MVWGTDSLATAEVDCLSLIHVPCEKNNRIVKQ